MAIGIGTFITLYLLWQNHKNHRCYKVSIIYGSLGIIVLFIAKTMAFEMEGIYYLINIVVAFIVLISGWIGYKNEKKSKRGKY